MRTTIFSLFALLLCFGEVARADKLGQPTTNTKRVADGKYIFVMLCPDGIETDQGKLIRDKYPKAGLYKNDDFKELLWGIDWYRDQVTVLPDGVHMVRYGNWPVHHMKKEPNISKESLKQEAVSFFAKGKLLHEYSIGELVDDATKLPQSVSHFRWMKSSKVIEEKLRFEVTTLDGNSFIFNVETGKIIEKKKAE